MTDWINSHNWKENVSSPHSRVDIAKFQRQLDEIVGFEPDGTKRLQIVWGQDPATTTIWDRYKGEWRLRYTWDKVRQERLSESSLSVLVDEYIGIPRYYIEAFIPRVHNNSKQEESGVDPDGDAYTEYKRVTAADYMTAVSILQHDVLVSESGWRPCCLDRHKEGKKCYGKYRLPDQIDIDTIREGFRQRIESKFSRPDVRLTTDDRELIYLEFARDLIRHKRQVIEENEYSRKHILSTLNHWLTDADISAKKKRFSIPGL